MKKATFTFFADLGSAEWNFNLLPDTLEFIDMLFHCFVVGSTAGNVGWHWVERACNPKFDYIHLLAIFRYRRPFWGVKCGVGLVWELLWSACGAVPVNKDSSIIFSVGWAFGAEGYAESIVKLEDLFCCYTSELTIVSVFKPDKCNRPRPWIDIIKELREYRKMEEKWQQIEQSPRKQGEKTNCRVQSSAKQLWTPAQGRKQAQAWLLINMIMLDSIGRKRSSGIRGCAI